MLVLVDSSIWIDLFSKKSSIKMTEKDLERVATCPPVIQEIIQGISDESARSEVRHRFLALPDLANPVETSDYLTASELFVLGRKKGHTIRSSIDCLIAAIAIRNNAPIWHKDRDFEMLAKFTSLRILRGQHL